MTWWVKCLPHKHGDLSSSPSSHVKPGQSHTVSQCQEAKTRTALELAGQKSTQTAKHQVQWGATEETPDSDLWPPYAHAHMCTVSLHSCAHPTVIRYKYNMKCQHDTWRYLFKQIVLLFYISSQTFFKKSNICFPFQAIM